MMGIAEFIIGRAFARDPLAQPILQKRKQVIAGRVLKDCGNRGPPTQNYNSCHPRLLRIMVQVGEV